MCEGILDGTRVSIKRVRVYTKGSLEAATKVQYWARYAPSFLSLMILVGPPS